MAIRFSLWTVILLTSQVFACHHQEEQGQKFAVIIAGARGYWNYFSQSDACHAYHTLINGGIPASNIIHFNYDDVATSPSNPFPNNLVNIPKGPNIYPGCHIDYRGKDVTTDVFFQVLAGNKSAIRQLTGKEGKVLESGPNDDVFLSFVDHGVHDIFVFPYEYLYAQDFNDALKKMHENKQYNRMLVYMESCYSGSMFDGLLPDNINIYGVSCANSHERGYMCCYDEARGVYVGSLFSNAWTYDTDKADRNTMTFKELFQKEVIACSQDPQYTSHPQQYGNVSFNEFVLAEFFGNGKNKSRNFDKTKNVLRFIPEEQKPDSPSLSPFLQSPPCDMVVIATLMRRLMAKDLTASQRLKLKQDLDLNLRVKKLAEELFQDMAKTAAQIDDTRSPDFFMSNQGTAKDLLCYKQALSQVGSHCPILELHTYPFIARNFHVLINICNQFGNGAVDYAIREATFHKEECRVVI